MKIIVEYDPKNDVDSPINFAKAIIEYMLEKDRPFTDMDYKKFIMDVGETVEYLNVYAKYLKSRG